MNDKNKYDSSNKKRHDLLGMPIGTAMHRLRKAIIFKFIQETGKDVCFRCGEKILTIEELSIEHKIPWQSSENPKEMFFDLENISFSHLKCNVPYNNNPPILYGENHPKSKLSNNQVLEIKNKIKLGYGDRKLASEYSVSRWAIWYIRQDLDWKNTK